MGVLDYRKYTIIITGVMYLHGHPSDPVSPFIKPKIKTMVRNIIQTKFRLGTMSPGQFRFQGDYGDFAPNDAIRGKISVYEGKVIFDFKLETVENKFEPYVFNGEYSILDKSQKSDTEE